MMKRMLLMALFCLLGTLRVHAQETQETTNRRWGITTTVQAQDFGILLPFWLGKNFVLAPGISIKTSKELGSDNSYGLVAKYYLKTARIAPYLSARGGAAVLRQKIDLGAGYPNETEVTTTDWIAGIAFGGDFFIDPQFSIGVEVQGNFTFADDNSLRFGNPGGTSFNTGSMLTASIYF